MHLLKTVIVQQKTDLQPQRGNKHILWPLAFQNSLERESLQRFSIFSMLQYNCSNYIKQADWTGSGIKMGLSDLWF
jgi:hypothetical protein